MNNHAEQRSHLTTIKPDARGVYYIPIINTDGVEIGIRATTVPPTGPIIVDTRSLRRAAKSRLQKALDFVGDLLH